MNDDPDYDQCIVRQVNLECIKNEYNDRNIVTLKENVKKMMIDTKDDAQEQNKLMNDSVLMSLLGYNVEEKMMDDFK